MSGCYNKLGSELGKPFMFLCITQEPDFFSPFFGKLEKYLIDDNRWLIVSNWRRLPVFKVTHMKDAYYSTLSSTMGTYLSRDIKGNYSSQKLKFIYSLRSIISLATNQRMSELLMDVRYAYMSAFSQYTNIKKLLIEKFKPPFKTVIDWWIISRLLKRLPVIFKAVMSGEAIKIKKAWFDSGRRLDSTKGGKLMVPSLWGDHMVYEAQEVLDEAFIYVHTIKEPSSMFHEEIKAINTITKFQKMYDKLKYPYKHGMVNHNNLRDFLWDTEYIGDRKSVV